MPAILLRSARLRTYTPILIAAAALIAFAILVGGNIATTSPTSDETTHLVSGYTYLETGDYRLNPEHPPLLKMMAAVPLRGMGVWFAEGGEGSEVYAYMREAWVMGLVKLEAQWLVADYVLYGLRDGAMRELGASPRFKPTTKVIPRAAYLNDAEGMFVRARVALGLLGIALGVLIFLWSRELWGVWGGVVSVVLFAFDPNFIAHSGLVTTDVGVSLLMFATVYCFWRWSQSGKIANAIGFVLACALALIAKYSAVILAPVLIVLAIVHVRRAEDRKRGALAVLAIGACAVVATWLAIWTAYGFRYSAVTDPAAAAREEDQARLTLRQPLLGAAPAWPRGHFPLRDVVEEWAAKRALLATNPSGILTEDQLMRARRTTGLGIGHRILLFAAERRLVPEAYLFGVSWVGSTSVTRSAYLRGQYSNTGFGSFFFWSTLYKTPIPALVAILIALALAWRRVPHGAGSFLIWPAAIYLGVSLMQNLNIGHRHILPIFPFVYVACGALALWPKKKVTVGLLAATAVSCLMVFLPKPAPMFGRHLSYLNEFAGGPWNGWDDLTDSNFDWGQDLERLGEWTRAKQLTEPINLVYFGNADPSFYGIRHHNLRSMEFPSPPQVPGYLAISTIDQLGVLFPPERRGHWKAYLDASGARLVDRAGYSILIYRIERR